MNEIGAIDCLQKFIDDFRDDDSLVTLSKMKPGQIALRYGMGQDQAAVFITSCRQRSGVRATYISTISPAVTLSPATPTALQPSRRCASLLDVPPNRPPPFNLPDCERNIASDEFFPTAKSSISTLIDRTPIEDAVRKDLVFPVEDQAAASVSKEASPLAVSSPEKAATAASVAPPADADSQPMSAFTISYDNPNAIISPDSTASEWSRAKTSILSSIQVLAPSHVPPLHAIQRNTGCRARRGVLLLSARTRVHFMYPGAALARAYFLKRRAAEGVHPCC